MRGHGDQGRYHKMYADEDLRGGAQPGRKVGRKTVTRNAVGQEVSSHYALDGAFPDV